MCNVIIMSVKKEITYFIESKGNIIRIDVNNSFIYLFGIEEVIHFKKSLDIILFELEKVVRKNNG